MSALEAVIEPRQRDIGDFTVARVLPSAARRSIGPFVFFDHFGPLALPAGRGMEVRPHPHIGLATVTYLFEGEILHRDDLGYVQAITPGAVNWMTAGRGIVHSERSSEAERARGPRLHGIQSWVALPQSEEETEPSFAHHPAASLPELSFPGATLRLIAGHGFGARAPVAVLAPTLYADLALAAGGGIAIPAEHAERAIHVVSGEIQLEGASHGPGHMLVLAEGSAPRIESRSGARALLLGGAPIDGPRHLWWNFVSSRRERIEQAKRDWAEGRFAAVPGEKDFIPLPD